MALQVGQVYSVKKERIHVCANMRDSKCTRIRITEIEYNDLFRYEFIAKDGSVCGTCKYCLSLSDLEIGPVRQKTVMSTLTTIAKKYLDADVKAFVQLGFMSNDLELTQSGAAFVVEQLFLANKELLGKAAKKHLQELKKSNKDCDEE